VKTRKNRAFCGGKKRKSGAVYHAGINHDAALRKRPGVAVSGPDAGNRAKLAIRSLIRDFTALAARGFCAAMYSKMTPKSPSARGV
jgi:hypothetical protein